MLHRTITIIASMITAVMLSTIPAAARPAVPAPTWHDSTCAFPTIGSVDIPARHGVRYTLDGVPERADSYWLEPGLHTVTARRGHHVVSSWSFTVRNLYWACLR
jgi:hypothetical protein